MKVSNTSDPQLISVVKMSNNFKSVGFNRTNRQLKTMNYFHYSRFSKFTGYKMATLYYFAYGSNILKSRIEDRVGRITESKPYKMKGWKLVFNCGHWYQAFANIIKGDKNDYVEGVLYELSPEQIHLLDRYEALPDNYYREYFCLPDGSIAYVYIATDEFVYKKGAEELPDLNYLNILLDGCIENKFKKTFNELFQFKVSNYVIKNNKHFEKFEDNF